MATFGEMLREKRKALRLGLREFAQRAELDAGNLSKIERGRLGAPQTTSTLDRICLALELDLDGDEAVALRDQSAAENGQIPEEISSDEPELAASSRRFETATPHPTPVSSSLNLLSFARARKS